jgi:tetratricopeptide (TPR) repeat protein
MEKLDLKFVLFLLLLNVNCLYSHSDYELGYKEYMNDNYEKSLEFFNKSIKNKKELAKSYMYRGAANIFLNRLSDTKRDLDTSFKLDSINGKIYFYFGKLYLVEKKYDSAIENYTIAIKKDSLNSGAYIERSGAKCMLGDYSGALNDSDIAMSIDSTNHINYTNRGYIKLKLKKYDDAIKDFDISLKIKPSQKGYANKGIASLNLNMFYAGINNFTKSLEFSPNDPEILYLRGYCYEQLGILDKACEDYNKSNSISFSDSAEKGLLRISCKK